ncbi:MAG TPA: peptide deformylase [Polyangiales bacterium]|nr:peptide deformylase [Polyangiales bacterium]
MAIRKVARLGHPVLRQVARDLSRAEILSEETGRLVNDMVETMREYGGVGLAAPQVHESVRLAVIEVEALGERYKVDAAQPLIVFFNAKVSVLDPAPHGFWEGCLSVPGMRGFVERPRKIRVDYLDEKAQPQTIIAEDFVATVFQHELDHLDGVLYVDKLADTSRYAFIEEYQRYHLQPNTPEVD